MNDRGLETNLYRPFGFHFVCSSPWFFPSIFKERMPYITVSLITFNIC